MIRAIKNILFTTNLSAECKYAYNYAISLATRYQGSITLLHVIEKLPISIESSLSNFLGQDCWERVILEQVKNARASLTGKITEHELVEIALERFCEDSKIGNSECHFQMDEIIIKEGHVIKEILSVAKLKESDIIILGSHKSIMKDTKVSKTAKGILQQSEVPVLLVPPPNKP